MRRRVLVYRTEAPGRERVGPTAFPKAKRP